MLMSDCVKKNAPLNVFPHPSPLTDFHQVWLSFYKKYFISLLLLIRLLQKIMHFQSKTIFFQLIVGRSTIMKLRIGNLCIDSCLASHKIMWHYQRILGYDLKTTSCFFRFPRKLSSRLVLPP